MKELLEAGVHFGHQTKRWNPRMKEYIFGERNGIYIVDLQKTLRLFKEALGFATQLGAGGRAPSRLRSVLVLEGTGRSVDLDPGEPLDARRHRRSLAPADLRRPPPPVVVELKVTEPQVPRPHLPFRPAVKAEERCPGPGGFERTVVRERNPHATTSTGAPTVVPEPAPDRM